MERRLNDTEIKLRNAFNRILCNRPQVISPSRRLSVRAVEEEAGVPRNRAYYYEQLRIDIMEAAESLHSVKSKEPKTPNTQNQDYLSLKREIKRLKTENAKLTSKNERLQVEFDKLSFEFRLAVRKNDELQRELNISEDSRKQANQKIAELKRNKIVPLE
ncbi:MAG: hypothetical protein MK192_08045 [Idiomarina sp.]|nr:hypothetical protein [Idiomarina sp.]